MYRECLLFQFFSRGIRMHIVTLAGIQNGRKKESYFAKECFFEVYFSDEGHLFANCLFYILSLCLTCLHFQIRTRGIRIHISIQTGVQKRHISG